MKAFKALLAAGVLSLAACSGGGGSAVPSATAGAPGASGSGSARLPDYSRALPATSPSPAPAQSGSPDAAPNACKANNGKHDKCHVKKNAFVPPNPNPNPLSVAGLTPADLRSAYGLTPIARGLAANGPTIAIVDAYDDPTAESDLAVYRARFGMPACTSANGCFNKLSAKLKNKKYPAFDPGWATEISLDLAMASAGCPTCSITLIEGDDDDIATLSALVDQASSLGVAAISSSFGTPESAQVVADNDAYYNHPGVPIVASAGDSYGVQFPASSKYVIAVTGSTLTRDSSKPRGWSERALSAGTGCSAVEAAPSWQRGHSACGTRAVGDIAFDADVNTGVAVFNSMDGGWEVLGGTSAGAPFVAGLYASAGNYGQTAGAAMLYAGANRLNAVTPAATGAVTALGSPNGFAGI